jgi:hypothetical protein
LVWTQVESLLALCGEGVLAAIHQPEAIAGVDGDGAVWLRSSSNGIAFGAAVQTPFT